MHQSIHEGGPVDKDSALSREQWTLEKCAEYGLRRTAALTAVIAELTALEKPISLGDLGQMGQTQKLEELCDQATLYRILIRLEQCGLVRKLRSHDRAALFVMKYPGEHGDYLVCDNCGETTLLEMDCPVEGLEQSLSKQSGYTNITHELEFFGLCPQCQST